MKKIGYLVKLFMIVLLIAAQSCSEDFLNEYPSNSQTPDNIKTIADALIVMNGSYDLLQDNDYWNANIITDNDVRSDDMQTADEGRIDDEYLYRYTAQTDFDADSWAQPFRILRHVNTILTIIDEIETSLPAEEVQKSDIKGQALAIRALAHFDLCRQFGRQYSHDDGASLGIPIVTSVLDPYAKMPRNTVAEVYTQVIADLNEAIPLLTEDKRLGQMNAWAAKTLLARVYLYKEDNPNAYTTALDVIDNGPYTLMSTNDYVDSWSNSGGSSESIFSILNNTADNGGGTSVNNLSDPGGYGQFVASQDLIDLIRSDPADVRMQMLYVCQVAMKLNPADPLADSTTWGRVLKYPGTGNTKAKIEAFQASGDPLDLDGAAYIGNVPVFRLSELYLIAAEAAIKNADATNAALYLNKIVERGNPANTVAEADATLDRILTERRKELMAEGHRFFDLVRNKKDIVRTTSNRIYDNATPLLIKWDDYRIIFPIPQRELNINPMTQNPGYKVI